MAKVIFVFAILTSTLLPNIVYSQEQNTSAGTDFSDTTVSAEPDPVSSKLIVYNTLFDKTRYMFMDGSTLNEQNIRPVLNTVPDNLLLLKQEKGLRITSQVMLAVCALAGLTYSLSDTLPNSDTVGYIAVGTQLGAILASIITDHLGTYKLNKAVGNYNLFIMGFPIRN